MEIHNQSQQIVRVNVFSGFPHTKGNQVVATSDLGTGDSTAEKLPSGTYDVVFSTTSIGPIAPGSVIASTGGVAAESSVTLTASNQISIQ